MHFRTTELFDKQIKKLRKKNKNIKHDLDTFLSNFETLHTQSTTIKKNLFKVRIANLRDACHSPSTINHLPTRTSKV